MHRIQIQCCSIGEAEQSSINLYPNPFVLLRFVVLLVFFYFLLLLAAFVSRVREL